MSDDGDTMHILEASGASMCCNQSPKQSLTLAKNVLI